VEVGPMPSKTFDLMFAYDIPMLFSAMLPMEKTYHHFEHGRLKMVVRCYG
jgi:hypothetical protein